MKQTRTKRLYDASYRLVEPVPKTLWEREALILVLELTNRGMVPWLNTGRHATMLSYHWRTHDGALVAEGPHVTVPLPVPPGRQVVLEMPVIAPPEPGSYQLEVSLVEEGVGWFTDFGVAPLKYNITFRPVSVPRICIINGNIVAHDAVGGHVAAQLRVLQAGPYYPLLLTEHVDSRLPASLRRSIVQLHVHHLQQPDWRTQAGVEHFFAADMLIVNYSTYYDLVQAIKLARNSAVIFDYHGVTPPHMWNPNSPGYDDLVRGREQLKLVGYADYAYGHSPYTAGELVQTGEISPARVGVLPYAIVEASSYGGAPDPNLLTAYKLCGKHVLLYVGRMARNKRIIDLIEALPLIREHLPEAVLLLVGDNAAPPYREYMEEVEQRAHDLGCADAVIFTGQVPAIAPFYDLCHVFVTASMHEGFGMPAVEAMSRGRPVIAANATASPQIIGESGLLFEPQNPADLAAQVVEALRDVPPHPPRAQDAALSMPLFAETASSREIDAMLAGRKFGFVSPRYGLNILGGAERHIRGWAEQLAQRGYPVEVLTTCTARMDNWINHFSPGTETINGVTVRRFATRPVDPSVFHNVLSRANHGQYVSYADEQAFMQHNLQSVDMIDHLRAHREEYAAVTCAPYLFGTTYWVIDALPERAMLLPCMHDEPAARFRVTREMLERVAGILWNTSAERTFAHTTLGLANPYGRLVGYGFDIDVPPGDGAAFRAKYRLPDTLLLYSGRIEGGKNVPLLLDYFTRYKDKHPGDLTLVLTGTGDVPMPQRPDVVAVGMLPESDLPGAFAAALALCQPSLNESFSIVMMEAWLQQRPVLVHAGSPVTSGHVYASGGGLTFDDYASFATALHQITGNPGYAAELGRRGQAYVQHEYSWDAVTNRLLAGITSFARPRRRYDVLAQRGVQRALSFTHERFADVFSTALAQVQDIGLRIDPQQRRRLLAAAQPSAPTPQQFQHEFLDILLPLLEQSFAEQRRLRRDIELLRERLQQRES
jgi:glycosyltransferase involved in cell wall biosynthesis